MRKEWQEKLKFMRPKEIYGKDGLDKKWNLWGSKGVTPYGIRQGSLGDCWLLATISGLGEWPERVKKIFKRADANKGIYEVQFWDKSGPVKVVVDDKLPVKVMGPGWTPVMREKFLKLGPNGAIWPLILEKAAAKYYGTYERMDRGFSNAAYFALTGRPAKNVESKKVTWD